MAVNSLGIFRNSFSSNQKSRSDLSCHFARKMDNEMAFREALAQQLMSRSAFLVAMEAGLFALLNVLALFGSVLVCCAVYRHRRHHTITNLFVTALAISDLIFALFVMPFTTGTFVVGRWTTGRAHCLFQGFCFMTFTTISLQTMCLIAINRYVCVVRPGKYKQKFFTFWKTMSYIGAAWILSCIASIPPLFWGKDDYSFHPGKGHCLYPFEINTAYTIPLGIIFIGIPFSVMSFCYSKVLMAVRCVPQVHPQGTQNGTTLTPNVEEVKITKTVSLVFLAFVLCWIPVGVIDFMDVSRGFPSHPRQVYVFQTFMTFLSSTINPFIYGLTSRKFRREYKKLVCCK